MSVTDGSLPTICHRRGHRFWREDFDPQSSTGTRFGENFMTTITTSEIEQTMRLLGELFPDAAKGRVSFRLWDGSSWPDDQSRAATIVMKHPGALRAMFATGTEKALAEAYLHDDFDVTGDIEAACELADTLAETSAGGWFSAARKLFHLRRQAPKPVLSRAWTGVGGATARQHSLVRDRQAVAFHYDVSNEFFRLWLDDMMLYSCAYFQQPGDSLDAAQEAKLEYLCRKLRLRSGQHVLDIGCGWGGFAIYAAKHYGVRVTGVTLSTEQASLAARRVDEAGLAGCVSIQLRDYRDLADAESFDAVISVGMAEHVGADQLNDYFARAFTSLKPCGVFLNHAIGDGVRARDGTGPSFIQEYVFPDSELPRIPAVLQAAEAAGFEVRDVENLREHYMLTLRYWVRRIEAAHEGTLRFVTEPTYRIWRLYMAGSARGFERGRLAIYQTLLVKPDLHGHSALPLTRHDWYARVDGADDSKRATPRVGNGVRQDFAS
jgi:cyclopropane-fatty-acyl-phospholipid synthase